MKRSSINFHPLGHVDQLDQLNEWEQLKDRPSSAPIDGGRLSYVGNMHMVNIEQDEDIISDGSSASTPLYHYVCTGATADELILNPDHAEDVNN